MSDNKIDKEHASSNSLSSSELSFSAPTAVNQQKRNFLIAATAQRG